MRAATRAVALACAAILLAGAGCKRKEVVVLHLETRSGSMLYWDRGVVTFDPQGDTWFRRYGEGTWAGGAVTYGVNEDGEFEIVMDGAWMQEQALANMERFGGSFVVEIPLTNVEASGSFILTARYEYNDEDDGTGWRTTHEGRLFGELELPFSPATGDKISLLMQCVDEQREACTPSGWDPDDVETPDLPDLPDIAEVEDVPDGTTDPDVTDMVAEPDATDTVAEPDATDDTGDPPVDVGPDPVDDTSAPDTAEIPDDTDGDGDGG